MAHQRTPIRWLKLTIAEPLPLFPALPEPNPGPFYAAGASWYYPISEARYAEWVASYQRQHGYTVTVEEVAR